jgi:hypothetical protein
MRPDGPWVTPGPGWICPECGFDYDGCARQDTSALVRAFAAQYRVPLERALPGEDLPALLRARAPGGAWSALEYACHARDGFWLSDERITTTVKHDRPTFERMHRDQLAVDRDYNAQDPAAVLDELARASQALAVELEWVPADAWERVAVRDGIELTVEWMARNAVHEGRHHLLDVARALRAARQAAPTRR